MKKTIMCRRGILTNSFRKAVSQPGFPDCGFACVMFGPHVSKDEMMVERYANSPLQGLLSNLDVCGRRNQEKPW